MGLDLNSSGDSSTYMAKLGWKWGQGHQLSRGLTQHGPSRGKSRPTLQPGFVRSGTDHAFM